MDLAEWPVVLILAGLTAYTVLGGADFGAGLWHMLLPGERRRPLRDHTYHAMGPVWEANHVWLIFVLVVAWTAYPSAFGSIFSTLYVPLFLAAVGIILRGTMYALRSQVTGGRDELVVGLIFGVSSVLTPFALGAAVGGIASGRVPVGNAAGEPFGSWLNPTSLTVGALAVVTSAYLAAVWLTADGARVGRDDLVGPFRNRALVTGALAGA
ncbi:MAG TPA: cytochrome d ubiquinol oxidase subunit II, partial [Gemmatimonadaceae bacterium]|nr:cytochrome d ubiquinol oxidase subunit II [Gemmatimonadaceae bacterium]